MKKLVKVVRRASTVPWVLFVLASGFAVAILGYGYTWLMEEGRGSGAAKYLVIEACRVHALTGTWPMSLDEFKNSSLPHELYRDHRYTFDLGGDSGNQLIAHVSYVVHGSTHRKSYRLKSVDHGYYGWDLTEMQ